jgi:hypothetical protein
VSNRGSVGGVFTPPGTAPKAKYEGRFWSLLHAGGDGLVSSLATNVAPPYTLVDCRQADQRRHRLLLRRRRRFTPERHPEQRRHDGAAPVWRSAFGGAATDTINAWNVIIGRFRNGTDSTINVNFPEGTDSNSGTLASTNLTGLSVGGAFNGTSGLQGEIAECMAIAGEPSTQSIIDYISTKYCAGWPKVGLLRRYPLTYLSTVNLAMVGGETWSMFGDSFTSLSVWYSAYATQVNATVVTPVTFVNNGVFGNTAADMLARITDVTGHGRSGCIIQVGTNDYAGFGGNTGTDIGAWINTCQKIINALVADGIPRNKIGFAGVCTRGERTPDPVRVPFEQYNFAANYLCNVNGCAFIDWYTPRLTFEAANNLPAPGNIQSPGPLGQTLLTTDTTHFNSTGVALASTAAFSKTNLSG